MVLPVPGKVPIRVLVVDDSAFMRFTITKHLNATPGLTVVGIGRDGQEALELIPNLQPDVITLDVEMPHMDGLTTLQQIMMRFPRPVVMLSSLTKEGAIETVQALTIGAVDFVTKPINKANISSVMEEVAKKILRASQARVWTNKSAEPILQQKHTGQKPTRSLQKQDKLVIIGASTGGPRALNTVVPRLPSDLPAAILIIQHMPAGFTHSLAERLDINSQLKIKEAEPGDAIEVGCCLVAPGGFHMLLDGNQKITLNQNPAVHGVRPAVDVTMTSAVTHFGDRIITAILTGMGNDGTNGALLIHSAGGWVIAEAEESSVVWGMPRSVIEAGAADEVVPLTEVASSISRAIKR